MAGERDLVPDLGLALVDPRVGDVWEDLRSEVLADVPTKGHVLVVPQLGVRFRLALLVLDHRGVGVPHGDGGPHCLVDRLRDRAVLREMLGGHVTVGRVESVDRVEGSGDRGALVVGQLGPRLGGLDLVEGAVADAVAEPQGAFDGDALVAEVGGVEHLDEVDVLRNYVTYATYYKLATTSPDDPELDVRKAAQAITRYASLHPSNLAQKAEIVVEHFRRKTRYGIGGRAKAMVVTRSRLHAVKYKQAIDAYIADKGYTDCATLVAFSGKVIDDTGGGEVIWTEAGMNGFPEGELRDKFAYTVADDPKAGTPEAAQETEYGVLVVAEKYQTGYDQPLLTTMFVDKKLEGVKAVQTLSRLNRTTRGKSQDDLFILDFANDAEDIAEAFKVFYETTIAEPTEPAVLYTLRNRIDAHPVIVEADIDALVAALLAMPAAERLTAHEKLHAHTNAAVTRFKQLAAGDPEAAEDFRDALGQFCRLYAFLAQVMPFTDDDLEKLYLYGRLLERRLPARQEGAVDLGEQVELTHLRITHTGTHDVSLDPTGDQEISGVTGGGEGKLNEHKTAALSSIVDTLNDRFGTSFTAADELHFEQSVAAAMEDPTIREQALANNEENFGYGFDPQFEGIVVDRHELNDALVQRFLGDSDFKDFVTAWARREAYRRIREDPEQQTG